jgi:hypothetical protein
MKGTIHTFLSLLSACSPPHVRVLVSRVARVDESYEESDLS